jgi:SPP1 gp7 family putative phage head morphogenesis protein
MTPAWPIEIERTLRRAVRQRQESGAGPERWAPLDLLQADTLAALLVTHTASQWSQATGRQLSPAALSAARANAATSIRSALAAAAAGDLDRDAGLVARDLTGQGRLHATRAAAEASGVLQFRWRTKRDERVRPEHAALEGQVYSMVGGAPGVGLPGEPWGCRCSMEPV